MIEQVRKAWGITVRDGFGQTETTAQIGNTPGQPVKPGSMGRPLPGYPVTLVDPVSGEPGRDGEICLDLSQPPARPDDRLPRRRRARRRGHARRLLPHRRRRDLRRRRLHHLRRAHGRRVQGVGLPDLAVRAGKRADRARGGRRGGGGALPRPDQARGAQGLRAARRRRRAGPELARDIMAFCRERVAPLQAHPPDRVRRPAQDDLRQDPPRRTARPGRASPVAAAASPSSGKRTSVSSLRPRT